MDVSFKEKFIEVKEKLETENFKEIEIDGLIRDIWEIYFYFSNKNEE